MGTGLGQAATVGVEVMVVQEHLADFCVCFLWHDWRRRRTGWVGRIWCQQWQWWGSFCEFGACYG